MLTQVRRILGKPPVLITIHVLALLFAVALYGFEVFGNHKPPTSGVLWRFLLVFVALCASLYRIIKNLKTSRKMIETHYADKIGHAFDEDPVKKKRLLSALLAYNRDDWGACLKKLHALTQQATNKEEKQVTKFFTAVCLQDMGLTPAALQVYNEILEENPSYAPALSNLSVIYFELEDYPKAITYAEQALDYNRDNPSAYHNLASACFFTYDLEKAKNYVTEALALRPDFPEATSLLAMIDTIAGDEEAAQSSLRRAVALGQDEEDIQGAIERMREKYAQQAAAE